MFAPYPQKNDGWFVIPGLLGDGRLVNVSADQIELPTADRPKNSEQFKSYRWRKYINFLGLKRNAKHRNYYGAWVCKDWNDSHDKSDQLQAFNMYFIKENTQPPGRAPRVSTHYLFSFHCRGAGSSAKNLVENSIKSLNNKELIKALNIR